MCVCVFVCVCVVLSCLKGDQPPSASVCGLGSLARTVAVACRLVKHQASGCAALWAHERPQVVLRNDLAVSMTSSQPSASRQASAFSTSAAAEVVVLDVSNIRSKLDAGRGGCARLDVS